MVIEILETIFSFNQSSELFFIFSFSWSSVRGFYYTNSIYAAHRWGSKGKCLLPNFTCSSLNI